MAEGKKYIFAGGNARSGTTALAEMLNSHPKILVTIERFMKELKQGDLRPLHLARDVMAAGSEEVPLMMARYGDSLAERWDAAAFVGDKVPALSMGFETLDTHFPDATLVYIVRNPIAVASSYANRQESGSWKRGVDAAVKQWNRSVRLGLQRRRDGKPLIVVPYEGMFSNRAIIDQVWQAMGLDPAEAMEDRLDRIFRSNRRIAEKEMARDDEMLQYISLNANFRLYRELIDEFALKPASSEVA